MDACCFSLFRRHTSFSSIGLHTSIASVATAGTILAPLSSSWACTDNTLSSGLYAPQMPTSSYPPNQAPLPPLLAPVHQSVPPSQPGLSLSPATEPIPSNLVQRIRSGQFIEMRDLMADNISLTGQLSQSHIPWSLGTGPRPRLREVPSLVSWLYCFNTYMAVRTSDPLTRDMLAYSRLLIRESLRHGGTGWLEYDRVFRKHLTISDDLRWNSQVFRQPLFLGNAHKVEGPTAPSAGSAITWHRIVL